MTDQNPQTPLDTDNVPELLSILPLFDATLFPKMVLPLVVMQDESVQLIDEAMAKDRIIGLLVSKRPEKVSSQSREDLAEVGTSALILKMAKSADNKTQLLVQGIGRFRVNEFVSGKPFLRGRIEKVSDIDHAGTEIEALMSNLVSQFLRVVELSPGLPQEIGQMAQSISEPGTLADMIASTINVANEDKQRVLEILDVKARLQQVTRLVNHQAEVLELGNKIQTQVKGDMDKRQREYYLRQQLKAIKEELGETDEATVEVDEYREKIEAKDLPEEARKEADRELNRMAKMHPSSAEYTVVSTYLDWITSLPWHDSTEDTLDIKKARNILDDDHYGLEKPKRRIIEYLAVRKLKPDSKGPILCFAGPPGTGKTSLGYSIARALGRKFVRISLGGVRDEAEIRGHRRTYVGAMPGRIIQGIRRAESNNPIFMLDEIDKVGSDFRGDPSSALLEGLDPEQNNSFQDHYLDVPFDLSKVMFITTANILDTIPPALRDRMEVLQLLGYTLDEKLKLAQKYLIPRQRNENGLKANQISFTQGAIKAIISGYTREAGLRNLEREIATICRGVASQIAEGKVTSYSVKIDDVHTFLGSVRFTSETKARIQTPGVATGLAWTPTGGELLFIEATAMNGKKGLNLTGQLGDVMKESAMAALSFIRANAKKLGIKENFFDELDIHIHVPAGGIKEKMLAAHCAGIKEIITPKANEKDLEDLSEKVKKDITFNFVDKMKNVLKLALPE